MFFISIICIWCVFMLHTDGNKIHHHSRIAFATEGRANEVAEWFRMISIMEHKSHITLFMLSYDIPINETVCTGHPHVVCIYGAGSTWTAGRNIMARRIAKYEAEHRHMFKYWMFGDHDMAKLDNCGEGTRCQSPEYPPQSTKLAACCFDVAMEVLMAPEVQWPVVNFNIWGGGVIVDYVSFSHMDCCDASLNAFHRQAVPVILPYIELVDKRSWWEAQGLQFHLVSSCFPSYSVYSNVFSIKATSAHSPYPMGRYPDYVNRALRQVYTKLDLIPNPITVATVQLEQGNCANLNHAALGLNGSYEPKINTTGSNGLKLKTSWNSAAWQNMTSFKRCLEHLKPRYLSYIESGDLTKTDGQVFS